MRISRLFKKALILMVILFGLIATTISLLSGWLLHRHLTDEYRSKAVAIARSIASSSPETFIHLDAANVQSVIDQYTEIQGVSYVTVSSPYGRIIAHTFVPQVPNDILQAHKKAQMVFKAGSEPPLQDIYVQEVGMIDLVRTFLSSSFICQVILSIA